MLGIVLPDSYSQSLANNYEWQSKVLNFHQHEVAYFLPSQHVQGGPLKKILQQEKVLNMLIAIGIMLYTLFFGGGSNDYLSDFCISESEKGCR